MDKKKARLNCIHHLLGQVPYEEVDRPLVELPPCERHSDHGRSPVPPDTIGPEVY